MSQSRRSVSVIGVLVALVLVVGASAGASGASGVRAAGSPVQDRRFVDAAVRDLLGRSASSADLTRWATPLSAGTLSRADVADQIARSPEWTEAVVRDLYARVLFREPDASGLGYWSRRLAAGIRTADLAASLYGSAEYYGEAGGTPQAFVQVVAIGILERPVDADGLAYWVAQLAAGRPRGEVARSFYRSIEASGLRVDALYDRLLGRAPDRAGRAYWARQLVLVDDLVLAARLITSDEYYRRAQLAPTTPTSTTTSLPNLTPTTARPAD